MMKRFRWCCRRRPSLKRAYRILFRSKLNREEALAAVEQDVSGHPEVEELTSFIRSSERGIVR